MGVQQKRATLPSGGNAPTKKNQTVCWLCFTASAAAFPKHSQGCSNRSWRSLKGKRKIADWPSNRVKALEGIAVMQAVISWELQTTPALPNGLAWGYTGSVFTSSK